MEEKGLIFGDEVYAIVLGTGFLEAVYQSALKLELRSLNIPFEFGKDLPVLYKGQRLDTLYRADLICYGKIIVELKALDRLTGKEESQIMNYLKATGFRVGVLVNFGSRGKLEWKRFAN